jgi:carboxylesterase
LSLASAIRPNPTTSPAEARARFAKLAARDDARISQAGRSRLIAGDARVRTAIVLIHGFTNCPQQWVTFARDFSTDEYAIVIPRLPGHGYADRSSRSIGRVTTEELVATVNEATDIAAGFADRIVLAGLSIGGAIGVWLALAREDVATTVSIVPFFGVAKFDAPANAFLAWLLVTLPDFFVPWDPSGKNTSVPPYGYTHFPTRVLGECLHVGVACYDAASARVPRGNVHFLLNAKEPACNNALSLAIANRFERDRPASTQTVVLNDLPANHDIIDPTNPEARIDIVYPQVRALIDG